MSPPDKRDPARGWRLIEKLLADDDPERLEKATDEEVVRQMDAQGVAQPSRVPGADEWRAKAAERAAKREASGAKGRALPVKTRRGPLVAWLAAAVVGGLVLALVVWSEPTKVATMAPDDAGAVPSARAATLREEAFAACGAGRWRVCEAKLEEAKTLDPAGDVEPPVQSAHRAAFRGLHPEGGGVTE